jgi:hypothetical protein
LTKMNSSLPSLRHLGSRPPPLETRTLAPAGPPGAPGRNGRR